MGLLFGLLVAVAMCAFVVSKNARLGIMATAVLAFGCNAYLFTRKLETATGPSLCNINEVFNCDLVNSSEASMLFGVPISLFGMAFYAGLALSALLAKDEDSSFFSMNTVFAIFSCVYSAYLAYVSKQLGAFCVMCITIYLSNGLLLFAGWFALKKLKKSFLEEAPKALTSPSMLTTAGMFLITSLVGQSYWSGQKASQPSNVNLDKPETVDQSQLAKLFHAPSGPVRLDGTEPVFGDPNAPYLILEYADFGCPHCAIAAKELKALVKANPDVQLRFRTFPLSSACNPHIPPNPQDPEGNMSVGRCHAAMASECAGEQGKFFEVSSLIFANQATALNPTDLASIAAQAGVDMPSWSACLERPDIVAGIRADASAGVEAGVQGTPTLFVRGTHGDQFVVADHDAAAAFKLIEAHRRGIPLPPARAHVPH